MDGEEKMEGTEKLEQLKAWLGGQERVIVSYSGGLDSSLLACVAKEVLGDRSLCVILDSPALPRGELSAAEDTARALDLRFRVLPFPFLIPTVSCNSPHRCYHCKRASAEVLKQVAEEEDTACIVDGLNLSDYQDFRPGIRGSDEAGIRHPLVEAGLTKDDIRSLARDMGLSFWSKQPSACLASRIPYGQEITVRKLMMVEQAEDLLKGLGLGQLRVRLHEGLARIEVAEDNLDLAWSLRSVLVPELKRMGFSYVTLDLEGYRTGSLNESLGSRDLDG